MNLHVISPGPLTTVQDAGRTGYAARGFRTCGAADGYAMRTANLLAGNPQAAGAAVLEMTLQGGILAFLSGSLADLRLCTCAQTVSKLLTYLDLCVCS